MSVTNYQEVAVDHRGGRRKVAAGEGMLVVRKNFTWQGERYKANVTRVTPRSPSVRLRARGSAQTRV